MSNISIMKRLACVSLAPAVQLKGVAVLPMRGHRAVPPHVVVDFVVLSPGRGSSVTDFWRWGAHEAQLRCPDDVSGDIEGCSVRRDLKPNFY